MSDAPAAADPPDSSDAAALPRSPGGRSHLRRLVVAGVVIALLVIIDQWTKVWAVETLKPEADARVYLGGLFVVDYAENPGGFLSLLGDATPRQRFLVLTVLNGLILVVVGGLLVFRRHLDRCSAWAFTFIFAGGISNLIDRVRTEGNVVIDFLNVGIGGLRTGIFNIADMAIMAGFGLMVLVALRGTDDAADGSELKPTSGPSDVADAAVPDASA